jgi:3-keto-disaccharide hydrolase
MRYPIALFALLLPLTVADPEPAPVRPTRHITLFNHKNLDGWTVWLHDHHHDDPSRVFSVVDGTIRISGEEWGGIATVGAYRDYRLVVEWKWGGATWGERKDRARDSGILVHGVGADGAASGNWLESIESQVIEGGAGDYIMVAGAGRPSVKAHARVDGDQTYWDTAADVRTIAEGRLNWFGRDPQWKDQLGFRGHRDVERPTGGWNRQEIVADGNRLTTILNGVKVNDASDSSHTAGRIQLQSEGAEIVIRNVDLYPVKATR